MIETTVEGQKYLQSRRLFAKLETENTPKLVRIREKIVEAHLPTEGPTETGNTANETMESSAVEIWDMTATLAGCTAIFLVQLVVAIRATAEVFFF